jgi:dTDP-4-dehydrorhamnose reductase
VYLIVGGDSLIGKALSCEFLSRGIPYRASTRDVRQVSSSSPYIDLKNCKNYHPKNNYVSAVICAAISRHDDCEKYSDDAYEINCLGTIELARKLNANGIHIVFLSTSQVFDGKNKFKSPEDRKSPISEYGRQKSHTEDAILRLGNTAVLRLSKVVHEGFPLFINWKNILKNGGVINAYKNYYFSPVALEKVVEKIINIMDDNMCGVYHNASDDDVTYYEYALSLARLLGVSSSCVKGVDSKFDGKRSKFNSLKE